MRKNIVKKILLSLYHYFCFFIFMAFIITCSMLLFITTMSKSINIELTAKNINTAAILTFCNVVFLSLVCTIIDALRRKITVERPVKKIISAAELIAKGDYSVRIPELQSIGRQDGLDKIVECFNKMAEELSGIETLQADFIANVSHELKTPLALIGNYAALLSMPNLQSEEQKKYIQGISDTASRLAELVTNILKLNKLENKQIYPTAKKYSLSEQLCECLLNFEKVWEDKNINIEADIKDDVFISEDADMMSLVWNNLLSNAFKFTDSGGLVKLTLESDCNLATVKITDTGCGISNDVGKHIFDKFYQGDKSHATQGNGLGLAMVRRVIDIVGADISVSSELGRGTVFSVKVKCSYNE